MNVHRVSRFAFCPHTRPPKMYQLRPNSEAAIRGLHNPIDGTLLSSSSL